MIEPPLVCSVRRCALPLTRRDRAYVCPVGHSFDVARSGYINLLQPQDRHSLAAGDSRNAVAARAALDAGGVGGMLLEGIVEATLGFIPQEAEAELLPESSPPVVVDLGSGTGEALGRLSLRRTIMGIGIDLSTAAGELAARRFPALIWVVANADRRLPLQDHCVDVALSINGRRNPGECARVLKEGGRLIVALPAHDDLIELRTRVHGEAIERDRVEVMLAQHRPMFQVIERASIRERVELAREDLLNLLRSTYRGARFASLDRVEAIDRMEVTLSSEVAVLKQAVGGRQ